MATPTSVTSNQAVETRSVAQANNPQQSETKKASAPDLNKSTIQPAAPSETSKSSGVQPPAADPKSANGSSDKEESWLTKPFTWIMKGCMCVYNAIWKGIQNIIYVLSFGTLFAEGTNSNNQPQNSEIDGGSSNTSPKDPNNEQNTSAT